MVGLSLTDLTGDDGLLRVFGKGSKERLVPIGRPARAALDRWLGPTGRPLHGAATGSPGGPTPRRCSSTSGEPGCPDRAPGPPSRAGPTGSGLGDVVSPHVLRHSCASHMLAHGADIRVVQEVLGHVSIATTQIYTRLSQDHLRSSYERAHPRAGRCRGQVGIRRDAERCPHRRARHRLPEPAADRAGPAAKRSCRELGFDDGRTGLEYDANFADTSQVTAERGEAEALAGKLKDTLEEVAAAIVRLDDGTYGECEVCGVAINPARLEAMPATRFCIDHANRA